MTDGLRFSDWEGEAVGVSYSHETPDYGILEQLTDLGLVLRVRRNFPAGEAVPDDMGGSIQEQSGREVSEFIPWHRVAKIRLLQPDELEARGL